MTETTPEPVPEPEQTTESAASFAQDLLPETSPAVSAPVSIPPPSRFKRFFGSALRWIGVALLGVLVGMAVMAYPTLRAQAKLGNVEKERDEALFKLALQSKLLAGLQIDQARMVVLRALSEVEAAQLALYDNDDINLPLFLDKASQVMKTAPEALMETQQNTVVKIQQKLALAQEKSKSNLQVTKSDLDQLLTDLVENLRNLDAVLNPNP